MTTKNVTCPHCGRAIQTDVITTLNETDETAWKSLLNHSLNTCVCPDCGTRFMVETPLTYRDVANPCIIYYMDLPEGTTQGLEQQLDAAAISMAEEQGIEPPVVRLTLTLWDFIEKIFLWRMGLDDRLVELAKHQLFRNTDLDKMPRTNNRLLVDFSNEDPEKLAFIIFDRETNKPVGGIHVPMEEYRKFATEFYSSDQMARELGHLFPTCYVSVERLI